MTQNALAATILLSRIESFRVYHTVQELQVRPLVDYL